ncbi:MAG: hypothetical protein HQL48_11860, partial [Gammaproteobacteria bacterium]|nr:hypothetical protein [Gammaproteobacteria bacterium]
MSNSVKPNLPLAPPKTVENTKFQINQKSCVGSCFGYKTMRAVCLLSALLFSAPLVATDAENGIRPQKYPLLEMGVGVLGVNFPDYPGAAHSRQLMLPFPSLTYRGEVLRSKADEGVRGRFLNDSNIELDFSADGSLASAAKDNRVR